MLFDPKSFLHVREAKAPVRLGRRSLLKYAAALGLGGAATKADASYMALPTAMSNNFNTQVQVANPGIGSSANTTLENLAFYSSDGDLVIGPGNRADITEIHNSAINLFKRHMSLRFDQAAFSATRPVQQTLWTPTGAGTFGIVVGSSGGILQLNTNASSAGDGGLLSQDFNGIVLDTSTKIYFFVNPITSSSNQVIFLGAQFDANNQVYFQRSDLGSESPWTCTCVVGGVATTIATAVMTGLNRIIFCITYDGTNVNFWIGNTNNTIILRQSIATNIPVGQTLKPYVKYNSQGSAVNRTLNITNMYTIANA